MASKKSGSSAKKADRFVTTQIPNTNIDVAFKLEGFAKSSAGTSGFDYATICATHQCEVKQKKYCPACGEDKPLLAFLKKWGSFVLQPSWIENRKVKGDGKLTIHQTWTDTTNLDPELAPLIPKAKLLTPALTGDAKADAASLKRYRALWQSLCNHEGEPARVAQVTYIERRTIHGTLRAMRNGYILFEERYRPEDTKRIYDEIAWPALKPAEVDTMIAKGLFVEAEPDILRFNEDAYRQRMTEEVFDVLAAAKPLQDELATLEIRFADAPTDGLAAEIAEAKARLDAMLASIEPKAEQETPMSMEADEDLLALC